MTVVATCKRDHIITDETRFWREDKRRAEGGFWTCRECYLEAKRLSQQRLREKAQRANDKRKKPFRDQRYRGPNQLVEDAALLIAQEADREHEVIADFAPRIAHGRIRFTPERSRQPTPAEVELAADQIRKAVEALAGNDKKAPLKHLNVKPNAERAWDRFNRALKAASEASTPEQRKASPQPNCYGKSDLFSDYDDDSVPTDEEAYALCYGCPLMELCAAFAEEEQPTHSVWAGEVFGKPDNYK